MQSNIAELIGVAAAAASLYAAQSRTIIPLRVAAIAANLLAMSYSFLHGTFPTFALNLVLLPLNAWRLWGMLVLIRNIDGAIKGDMNADWLLPYTRPKHFNAGDIIMDAANMPPLPTTSFPVRSKSLGSTKRLERELSSAKSVSLLPTAGASVR